MARYWRWKAEKLFARVFLLPILIILYPITTLGHWLGVLYQKLR